MCSSQELNMDEENARVGGQELPPLVPADFDGLTEAMSKRAYVELFEDEETKNQCINIVKKLLRDDKNEYRNDDLFILQFLRARKFDAKKTYSLIKSQYSTLRRYPELYDNFNVNVVYKALDTECIGIMPYRDADGSVIFAFQNRKWDTSILSVPDIITSVTACAFCILRCPTTQVAGVRCVLDFKGLTLKRLAYVHPSYYWLIADALQNCLPLRFRSLHVMNAGMVFDYAWRIFKPLISKKIKDRIHFHGKDFAALHEHISPRFLTEEFGGELGAFNNKCLINQFKLSEDYIQDYMAEIMRKRDS